MATEHVIGLLPAAGYATRLGDTIAGSKEVQVVRGRPVMSYLLDRFALGGAEAIRVVTRPEKLDVIDRARAIGAVVVEGYPPTVSASLRLGMEGLDPGAIALFGFPDTIWSPRDGFRSLRRAVEAGAPLALGLFDSDDPTRADVAILDADGRLIGVDVKPAAPATSLVWAAVAARVGVLRDILADVEPGIAFDRAARAGPVATVRLGRVIDIGTPASLLAAADDPVFGFDGDTPEDAPG